MKLFISLLLLPALAGTGWSAMFQKTKRAPQPTALDRYVSEAAGRPTVEGTGSSAGSTWTAVSPLYDLARDLRAAQVDDLVTIIVAERASAVTTGATTDIEEIQRHQFNRCFSRSDDAGRSAGKSGEFVGSHRTRRQRINLSIDRFDDQPHGPRAPKCYPMVFLLSKAQRMCRSIPNGRPLRSAA